jgi:dipeptidase E
MSNSRRLYYEEMGEYEERDGMGFVGILIRPHLNSPHFPDVNLENLEKMSKELSETFYAIDDDTAIKVVDGKIDIISEGVWKKFN